MNGGLKVITDFSAGLGSKPEKGTEVTVCRGMRRRGKVRPSAKVTALRFQGATSDYTDSLNLKKLFAFGKYLLGITQSFSLTYSSVSSMGFIGTGVSFSEVPKAREISYNGKPAVLLFTEKTGDSSVIWFSPSEPYIALPSVCLTDVIQAKNKTFGLKPESSGVLTTETTDVCEWNTTEKTLTETGETGVLAKLETAGYGLYAFGSSAVFKVGETLTPLCRLRGISVSSICRVKESLYFTAENGLYKVSGDSLTKVFSFEFSENAKTASRGEDIVICDGKVYLYSTENDYLSELGSLSVKDLIYSDSADRIIVLTQDGQYGQVELNAAGSEYEAEYAVVTDFNAPHTRKRLNYLSLVVKGEFTVTLSGSEGGGFTQTVNSDGKRPVVLPANVAGSSFTLSVKAKCNPTSSLTSIAGNVTPLTEDAL